MDTDRERSTSAASGEFWYYQAYVDGKQIGPISSKSTDREVVQRELDKLLGKRARGEIVHSRRDEQIVSDLLDDYLAYADERLESAKIIRWLIEANVRPMLGRVAIPRCDVNRLRKYRQERAAAGADDVTINRELSYLRAAVVTLACGAEKCSGWTFWMSIWRTDS